MHTYITHSERVVKEKIVSWGSTNSREKENVKSGVNIHLNELTGVLYYMSTV